MPKLERGGRAASRRDAPVQARALRTREALVDAGRGAFGAYGFDGTNIATDVLQPAGVSTGSFYHQFANKAELFAAVVESSIERATVTVASIAPQRDEGVVEAARRGFLTLLTIVEDDPDSFRIHNRDRHHPDPAVSGPLRRLRAVWSGALGDPILSAFDPGEDVDVEGAASMVDALATGVIVRFLELDPAERAGRRASVVERSTVFALGGLMALHGNQPLAAP